MIDGQGEEERGDNEIELFFFFFLKLFYRFGCYV